MSEQPIDRASLLDEAEFFRFDNPASENEEASLFGRAIKWLRAPNEIDLVKGARKALAIFLACVLSLTVIGIVPVVIGVLAWKKQ